MRKKIVKRQSMMGEDDEPWEERGRGAAGGL